MSRSAHARRVTPDCGDFRISSLAENAKAGVS
jgi:hypothetical protein